QIHTRSLHDALPISEQAEQWLSTMKTRRRKPVKPATIAGWRHSLDRWLLPLVGELRLAEVGNATLKMVIDKMTASGLAAQSIITDRKSTRLNSSHQI